MISMGGGGQESSQQSTQGFRDLPPEIQNVFKSLATEAAGYIPASYGANFFKPVGENALETQAIQRIQKGFTPTAQSISSDIAMQQNPYDQYVIDAINREAGGQGSVLNQQLSQAGQFGSNRAFLGANDIDLTRLGQIGQFKQQGFNTAMNNALTVLPQSRAQDATNLMNAGQFRRGLATEQQQAPISALKNISAILGVLPTNSGQSSGSSSGSNWNFGLNF